MGAGEALLAGSVEAAVKYHFSTVLCLMRRRDPGRRQGQAGSLTGAVASQKVTEACEGTLRLIGNQPSSAMA